MWKFITLIFKAWILFNIIMFMFGFLAISLMAISD